MTRETRYSRFESPKKRSFRKTLYFFTRTAFFLAFLFSLATFAVFAYYAKDLPNAQKIRERQLAQSTKIYDKNGTVLLYDVHGEEKRTVIGINDIPQHVKDATVVAEDDDFYHHYGLDFKSTLRAALKNIERGGIRQGGSTITQQFVKNSLLSSERTFSRKIKEVILAIELELFYSKDEILEFYLNQIPYGSNAYGIEAAAQTYFGKSAKDLSHGEAAVVAALPKAPTYYSPYGSHPEELETRKNYILDRMEHFGYLDTNEAKRAKEETLVFSKHTQGIRAPHFVMYVREYIEEKYGKAYVEQAGLKVTTSLDSELQEKAEELVRKYGEVNRKNFGARNAALTAIDPETGQILAMVGSIDYFDLENDGNVNVTIRPRQPGSSFKPIVYAAAFEKGYTPETIVFDVETEFALGGTPSYKPQNYDGSFRGPVSFRQALAGSLNVPAVKVLHLVGVSQALEFAKKLGITTFTDPTRYGLALVLGGGEIKLLEEVSAFGVFAQDGTRHPPTPILRIETASGEILEEYQPKGERVLSPQTARTINSILSDEEARTPIFGPHSSLFIPEAAVAVKTGTTQEYRDAWTAGYTTKTVVGVWAGNNDNSRMKGKADGLYVAAPLWNEFMRFAIEKRGSAPFEAPEKTPDDIKPILRGNYIYEKKERFDKASGKIATSLTPPWMTEERINSEIHSILFWVDKDNPRGPFPKAHDPQYGNWEEGIERWLRESGKKLLPSSQKLQKEFDDLHTPEKKPRLTILSPSFSYGVKKNTLEIDLEVEAPLGIEQIDFFLAGSFLGSRSYSRTSSSSRVQLSLPIKHPDDIPSRAALRVKLYDTAGNSAQDETVVYLRLPE